MLTCHLQLKVKSKTRVSFLDVQIIPEDETFITYVYRKPTFSGVYAHFDRFLPSTYKFGTVYTLACESARVGLNYTTN